MTPSILVVEDEPAIRELLRVNLASAGYAVDGAPDAETARTKVNAALPDLLPARKASDEPVDVPA